MSEGEPSLSGSRPETQGPLRAQEPLGDGVEPEQLHPPSGREVFPDGETPSPVTPFGYLARLALIAPLRLGRAMAAVPWETRSQWLDKPGALTNPILEQWLYDDLIRWGPMPAELGSQDTVRIVQAQQP